MTTTLISNDFSAAQALVTALRVLDGQTLSDMRRNTVQATSETVRRKAIAQVRQELNLSEQYVTSRLEQIEGRAQGAGTWVGGVRSPFEGTTMQRFGSGPSQLTKPVNWDNNYINSKQAANIGAWVDGKWTLRTGDSSRGIPANQKQNGVMVAIKRSAPKRIATGFTMPLRRGGAAGGNGLGVFRRNLTTGRLEHLKGPSVYQVFRRYIRENEQRIADDLRDEFAVRLDLATRGLTT
jgi:hypothetical protein